METVDALLTRDRRDDRPALVDATGREFDYHWLCTTAWKSGNFLRHAGVREGVTVGVVGAGPLALEAFFGTTLLEGRTQFEPPTDLTAADDLRALVAPVDALDRYELPRGAQRVGYGDKPGQPDVHHFDAGIWSENPAFPPLSVAPDTDILTDEDRTYTHEDVLAAAGDVIDEYGLETGDRVVVRASLSDPRTVVAGVIAPLLTEGVVVLTGDEPAEVTTDRGSHAVSSDSVPEPRRIDPDSVALS
ncbi:hypothetical protein [Halosolutus halophilus]|uniref:hypothetical protein n=1 Tax=Halosolutus halophilus TaxID=1552990 RepID=UPI002234F519|nr:hypothetical protein [Halosolutus halophilus]